MSLGKTIGIRLVVIVWTSPNVLSIQRNQFFCHERSSLIVLR
jgi:hypothetical protein